mmetsp:Transcript_10482/g.43674  ORF Transcript_10482/g.43674 Transcript_10482/m.43674 type:complete len:214 (+) Transcript_10482:1605-2246(+)
MGSGPLGGGNVGSCRTEFDSCSYSGRAAGPKKLRWVIPAAVASAPRTNASLWAISTLESSECSRRNWSRSCFRLILLAESCFSSDSAAREPSTPNAVFMEPAKGSKNLHALGGNRLSSKKMLLSASFMDRSVASFNFVIASLAVVAPSRSSGLPFVSTTLQTSRATASLLPTSERFSSWRCKACGSTLPLSSSPRADEGWESASALLEGLCSG